MLDHTTRRSVPDDAERVGRIVALAQRLLIDVASSGYGHEVQLEYLTPRCAARVQRALDIVTGDGATIEADYGESVSGTAYLATADAAVQIALIVDDRSMRRHCDGRREGLPPARWLVGLEVDATCTRITDLRVTAA